MSDAVVSPKRRDLLTQRVRWFVTATISYNVIEAVIALGAGAAASSAALIGFGLDSAIEVSSAAAVAWQYAAREHAVRHARERRALRVIAVSFFALAGYVTVDAARALLGGAEADHSIVGVALAAVSLVVMPLLSHAQRRAGRELGSASAVADSKQTLICAYLSGVLLVGLGLNALFGWSWADPLAALVIAGFAVREGRSAWRGEGCCGVASMPGGAEDGCLAVGAESDGGHHPDRERDTDEGKCIDDDHRVDGCTDLGVGGQGEECCDGRC